MGDIILLYPRFGEGSFHVRTRVPDSLDHQLCTHFPFFSSFSLSQIHLVNNVTLSTQPISSFDWHPDKLGLAVCSAFDQAIRVVIVTKLNRL